MIMIIEHGPSRGITPAKVWVGHVGVPQDVKTWTIEVTLNPDLAPDKSDVAPPVVDCRHHRYVVD